MNGHSSAQSKLVLAPEPFPLISIMVVLRSATNSLVSQIQGPWTQNFKLNLKEPDPQSRI